MVSSVQMLPLVKLRRLAPELHARQMGEFLNQAELVDLPSREGKRGVL